MRQYRLHPHQHAFGLEYDPVGGAVNRLGNGSDFARHLVGPAYAMIQERGRICALAEILKETCDGPTLVMRANPVGQPHDSQQIRPSRFTPRQGIKRVIERRGRDRLVQVCRYGSAITLFTGISADKIFIAILWKRPARDGA